MLDTNPSSLITQHRQSGSLRRLSYGDRLLHNARVMGTVKNYLWIVIRHAFAARIVISRHVESSLDREGMMLKYCRSADGFPRESFGCSVCRASRSGRTTLSSNLAGEAAGIVGHSLVGRRFVFHQSLGAGFSSITLPLEIAHPLSLPVWL